MDRVEATKESFDYQWENLAVDYNEEDLIEHKNQIIEFTQISPEWFFGRKVIDVGCGGGRYTWGFCSLGCDVTAVDQSLEALALTEKVCKGFDLKTEQVDILLPFDGKFDFVWCFGVIHHTGDTYTALDNIMSLVKDGGYLFLMVYGKPRDESEYKEIEKYERLRDEVKDMSFEERAKYLSKKITEPKKLHGYFDAVSPAINDLYDFEEIRWFLEAGGFHCKFTSTNRNHRIIARKGKLI